MTVRERDAELPTGRREAQPVWLTIGEAAEVMRLGRNKLYQLVAEGVVPHRKLGRSIHIHREVAEHWTPDAIVRTTASGRLFRSSVHDRRHGTHAL